MCPMSVWGQNEAVLPDTVEAIVGRLLHAVRDTILQQQLLGPAHTQKVRDILRETKNSEEQRLASVDGCATLVPLETSIGHRRWLELSSRLISWAKSSVPTSARPPKDRRVASDRATDDGGDAISFGAEQRWTSSELRLRGRPDESVLAADGAVEVTDYKTGVVIDEEGRLAHAVETQVQLYLLMAEVLTGRDVRGRVVSDRVTVVSWGEPERDALKARLSAASEAFPADAQLRSADVAKAGPHCIGCRLRPRCATYLESAPQWWSERAENPRPLPFDTWGVVTSYEQQDGVVLRIRDAGERPVVVRGLSSLHSLAAGVVDQRIFIFSLQPSEDLNHHGRRLHPQAFHEGSPGPRWPTARQVAIFGSPAGSTSNGSTGRTSQE